MWDKLYYGNSLRDWGISLLIIVGALILNKLISIINRRVVRRIAERSRTRIDDLLSDALEPPILLFLRNAYEVLVTLNVTWLFARVIARLIESLFTSRDGSATTRLNINTHLIPLIKRGVLIIVWAIGIVMALHNIGVTVTTLMGTLGIGGMAFALASQDTIKNIFGGVTIFTDQTFQIGDIIRIGDTEGTVVDVGLRSTRLRTYDGQLVILPNSQLIDAVVTNISSEPGRRIVIDLGLTYDTSPEKMRQAMAILSSMDDRVRGVEPGSIIAAFVAFADSSLTIRLIYFIRKSADILGTQTEVNFDILSQFNAAGLNFAFPTRTIYIDKGSDLS